VSNKKEKCQKMVILGCLKETKHDADEANMVGKESPHFCESNDVF
jgi:hypothetical protein